MDRIKDFLIGSQPLKKEVKVEKISLNSLPRDTAARGKFINSMHLEQYFPKDDLQTIRDKIDKLDAGHIVGRCEGGSNDPENFILEEKKENREPGLKRNIERGNNQMLLSGKKVENEFTLYFDKRIPLKVPAQYQIRQIIKWRNGRLYQEKNFEMSDRPYLDFATIPEMCDLFIKSDVKESATQALYTAGSCGVIKFASSNQPIKDRVIGATKTALKTSSPYIAKGAVKVTLDYLQTSKFLSQEVRDKVALLNVNRNFNTVVNNLARFTANKIFIDELKKFN